MLSTTATIRESNVFTDTFLCLYSKINTISDPRGRSKWIYSSYPDIKNESEVDYPIIVVGHSDVTADPLTFKNVKDGPIRISIDVYSTSAQQTDSLSDSIAATMESNESNFFTSGIHIMRLVSTSYGYFPRGTLRIHNKTLNYQFNFKWY